MKTVKSLDQKLARIHTDPTGAKDFILADAKDADMALGIAAPGPTMGQAAKQHPHRSLAEYREQMRLIIEQGLVDIMLMSASTLEQLVIRERLFDRSSITPAGRCNDTTDIHIYRGGTSAQQASLPFRTATLDHLMHGKRVDHGTEVSKGVNLGLYSLTFNNDARLDREALEGYKTFRLEAEAKGFRHFLEVFDPNVAGAVPDEQIPGYINDAIVRTLAGVTQVGRPIFLKIVYHGPEALEELVHYDPHLVVGVLGGSAGTTYDAFKLLAEAKKYGARAALFGRKINQAENQLAFIQFLRYVADGVISPEEAVRAYHGVLERLGIKPWRSLREDMQLHSNVMSYGGSNTVISLPPTKPKRAIKQCGCAESAASSCACNYAKATGAHHSVPMIEPDFSKMSQAEKVQYNLDRWRRILG